MFLVLQKHFPIPMQQPIADVFSYFFPDSPNNFYFIPPTSHHLRDFQQYIPSLPYPCNFLRNILHIDTFKAVTYGKLWAKALQ